MVVLGFCISGTVQMGQIDVGYIAETTETMIRQKKRKLDY
jgi:hypothetical protein